MSLPVAWILIVFASINSALGNYLLKKSQTLNHSFLASLFTVHFIGGILLYGINVLLFAYALKDLPVSKAYPVLAALSFIAVAILGHYLLGERLAIVNLFGIAVIILGIFMLTR